MRTVFVRGEIEQYLRSRTALVEGFTSGSPDEDAEIAPLVVRALLDDKFTRDGLLVSWTEADVEHVLGELFPRRMTLESGWSSVPATVHRWLDHLADSGLLVLSGASSLDSLHAAVERATPAFVEGMTEPSEWGSAKFWSVTMGEHGVDVTDESAVEGFFERVDEGEVDIDEDALAVIEEREQDEPEPLPAQWLPLAEEPDDQELAAELGDNRLVTRLRALLEWVGAGREIDGAGEVPEADLGALAGLLGSARHEADLLLAWAGRARLVTRAGDHVVPTQISAPLLDEPRLLWEHMWKAFALLDEELAAGVDAFERFDDATEAFVAAVTSSLRMLYSQREPVPLEIMASAVAYALVSDEDDEATSEEHVVVRELLRRIFEQWDLMGAVRLSEAESEDLVEDIGVAVPDGVSVDLTMVELAPLGMGAARRSLEAVGYVAPSMEDLAAFSAELAVSVTAECPPELGDRVCASWIAARGARRAGEELATLLSRVDDPMVRLGALSFLEGTGSEGADAVRALVDDPTAGAAARVWLRERSDGAEVAVRPDDDVLLQLDSMAVAVEDSPEMFLEQFRLGSTTEQVAMVEEIARVSHSRRGAVLEVIASGHPDSRVSGIARRSLARTADAGT